MTRDRESGVPDDIWRDLLELYTEPEALRWLCAQQKLLDWRRPVDLIAEDDADAVRRIIRQVLDGVYV